MAGNTCCPAHSQLLTKGVRRGLFSPQVLRKVFSSHNLDLVQIPPQHLLDFEYNMLLQTFTKVYRQFIWQLYWQMKSHSHCDT